MQIQQGRQIWIHALSVPPATSVDRQLISRQIVREVITVRQAL